MCRSQAEGGRRCNGGGKAGGSSAAPLAASLMDSEESILARNPQARLINGGKPLTDAQRRLYTLRDGGYTGWIDQDGYAVAGEPLIKGK